MSDPLHPDLHPRLHLGLTPWRLREAPSADDLCEQASRAEGWGYDSLFLPESHFSGPAAIPDPLLLLAAVAGRTRRMQLGTTSWLLPIRNPVLAAEQAAVLDHLCQGRLILGLGRGYQPELLGRFGVQLKDKREKFGEVLSEMLAAWRDGEVSPPPLQAPHPPLWVAAFGPRAIRQVGGLGLPYLASPLETFDELEQNYARHQQAVDEAGLPRPAAVPVMRTVFISTDGGRCRDVRDRLEGTPWKDRSMVGSPEAVADQVALYQERLGMTHLVAARPRVGGIEEAWILESLERLLRIREPLSAES